MVVSLVTSEKFRGQHVATLECNEARHMMMLGVLNAADAQLASVKFWSLGSPGKCALLRSNGQLILGDLSARECRTFAEHVEGVIYNGVIGPDQSALHFVGRAVELGQHFLEPMPQRIHSLAQLPRYPDAPGLHRPATAGDVELLTEWMRAFVFEATPHDVPPTRDQILKGVTEGRYYVWLVEDKPVSTAAIVRRTRHTGGIAAVFTPTESRGKGYAGSITAAVAEALFREGKKMACINTDLRNPISNRCYAKIGFKPVCDAVFFPCQPKTT